MKTYMYIIILLLCAPVFVTAQNIPTVGDVYSFSTGDIFGYHSQTYTASMGHNSSSAAFYTVYVANRQDSSDTNGQLVAITYTVNITTVDTVALHQVNAEWTEYHTNDSTLQYTITNLNEPLFNPCNLNDTTCNDSLYTKIADYGHTQPDTVYGYRTRFLDYNQIPVDSIYTYIREYAAKLGSVYNYIGLNVRGSSMCNCTMYESNQLISYTHIDTLIQGLPTGTPAGTAIILYPNPAGNMATIKSDLLSNSGAQILLYNTTGTEQFVSYNINGNLCHLALQDIKAGVYMVRIQAGTQTETLRLMKL